MTKYAKLSLFGALLILLRSKLAEIIGEKINRIKIWYAVANTEPNGKRNISQNQKVSGSVSPYIHFIRAQLIFDSVEQAYSERCEYILPEMMNYCIKG